MPTNVVTLRLVEAEFLSSTSPCMVVSTAIGDIVPLKTQVTKTQKRHKPITTAKSEYQVPTSNARSTRLAPIELDTPPPLIDLRRIKSGRKIVTQVRTVWVNLLGT